MREMRGRKEKKEKKTPRREERKKGTGGMGDEAKKKNLDMFNMESTEVEEQKNVNQTSDARTPDRREESEMSFRESQLGSFHQHRCTRAGGQINLIKWFKDHLGDCNGTETFHSYRTSAGRKISINCLRTWKKSPISECAVITELWSGTDAKHDTVPTRAGREHGRGERRASAHSFPSLFRCSCLGMHSVEQQ